MNATLKTLLLGAVSALASLVYVGDTEAGNISQFTGPGGTNPIDNGPLVGDLNKVVSAINTTDGFNPMCAATATTSIATCQGLRGQITTPSLALSQGAATAMTITDASVSASSILNCQIQAYAGTYVTNGVPVVTMCTPGTGTFLAEIVNVSPAATAMAGTVMVGFEVFN